MTINVSSIISTGSGAMVKLAQVVTSGSQLTIDFTSIPNTYTDLLIKFWGRDTSSVANDLSVFMTLNGDTNAANYEACQYLVTAVSSVTAGTVSSTTSGSLVCKAPGTLSNANAVSASEIRINNYASTNFFKVINASTRTFGGTGATAMQVLEVGWAYLQNTAISRITLFKGGTAFANGSTATLYALG